MILLTCQQLLSNHFHPLMDSSTQVRSPTSSLVLTLLRILPVSFNSFFLTKLMTASASFRSSTTNICVWGALFKFSWTILVNFITQATTINIFFQLDSLICNHDTISPSILLAFTVAVFFTPGSSLMSLTSLSFDWGHLDSSHHKNSAPVSQCSIFSKFDGVKPNDVL